MSDVKCYIALGGNLENTLTALQSAFLFFQKHPNIHNLKPSSLYRTSPVSDDILQNDYLNGVFSFDTSLPLTSLWNLLEDLENRLGKTKKPKNAPRLIDLDLLFYGNLFFHSDSLTVPHPRWHTRLFVVTPLFDLLQTPEIENLRFFLSNKNQERVEAISLSFCQEHS